jgi:hypothetical protein
MREGVVGCTDRVFLALCNDLTWVMAMTHAKRITNTYEGMGRGCEPICGCSVACINPT